MKYAEIPTLKLEHLVGRHLCTGHGQDGGALIVGLDHRWFKFVEDENDGYRSTMAMVQELPRQPVGSVCFRQDVTITLEREVITAVTDDGELLFRAGTDNYDDYYPSYVGEWHDCENK